MEVLKWIYLYADGIFSYIPIYWILWKIAFFSKTLEAKISGINSNFQNNFPAVNSPKNNLSPLPLSEKTSEKLTKYDAVFSVNYFSYIAEVCHRQNIRYICYNVDSPLLNMQHPSVNYQTNCIYTFDSSEAKHFNNNGTDTVHYLPLCTNTKLHTKIFL